MLDAYLVSRLEDVPNDVGNVRTSWDRDPYYSAPMGGAVGPALAAAVSNAGGLGTLALWGADVDTLRRQVRETQALTSKPFAVNLNLEFPQDKRLEACLAEGVPIISFFWREPSALVRRANGAVVLHTVSTAKEARQAVECGVDVVVAQGWEAGSSIPDWTKQRLGEEDLREAGDAGGPPRTRRQVEMRQACLPVGQVGPVAPATYQGFVKR
jgi:Nitronate monooxygenase